MYACQTVTFKQSYILFQGLLFDTINMCDPGRTIINLTIPHPGMIGILKSHKIASVPSTHSRCPFVMQFCTDYGRASTVFREKTNRADSRKINYEQAGFRDI